jgi:anti-sigma factor RsiW
MKEYQDQLKLQAYLDGELPEAEAREVANWLARDQDAVGLLSELRHTRKALMGFEEGIKLPETSEFYWSKIQREIERQEIRVGQKSVSGIPLLTRLRRFLVPVAGLALLAIAGLLATQTSSRGGIGTETALADSGAFTYHDFDSGTTLVWLSYPADNELAMNDDPGSLE